MKRFLIVIVILAAIGSILAGILGITATCVFAGTRIKGSGHIVTRTIEAPDFHAIDASRAVEVFVVDDASGKITIEADDNVMEYVMVKVHEGELKVGIDKTINNLNDVTIRVTVPYNGHIYELDASSASKIIAKVPFTGNKLDIDASSAAHIEVTATVTEGSAEASSASKIDATIRAVEFEADASSAAKITLKGSADSFDAEASSAAKIDASELVTKNCDAEASSAARIEVNCTEKLRAEASSGASVYYSGTCTYVTINKSSGGSVSKQ